ncbi:MAG: cytochrome c [Planctomycetota bacterium]
MNRAPLLLVSIAIAALLSGPFLGCRGERSDKPPRQFFPGMDDNPRWDPQEQSDFYADGRTMRPSVEGTVAFGRSAVAIEQDWAGAYQLERARMLKADDAVHTARGADGNLVRDIPIPLTAELLADGQKHYEIYCAACHGYTGDGKGMVGEKWSYILPNFHDEKYIDKDDAEGLGTDGHLWNIARYGKYDVQGVQKMPGYAHALNETEAWGVVAYIRALQAARRGSLDDAPASKREMLRQQQGPAADATRPASPDADRADTTLSQGDTR